MNESAELLQIRRAAQKIVRQIDNILARKQKRKKTWTKEELKAFLDQDIETFFESHPFLETRKMVMSDLEETSVLKVSDLTEITKREMSYMRGVGNKILQTIEEKLLAYGLTFKP